MLFGADPQFGSVGVLAIHHMARRRQGLLPRGKHDARAERRRQQVMRRGPMSAADGRLQRRLRALLREALAQATVDTGRCILRRGLRLLSKKVGE